jgi:hypothetical protein
LCLCKNIKNIEINLEKVNFKIWIEIKINSLVLK